MASTQESVHVVDTPRPHFKKTLEEAYDMLEKDIKEEGHKWDVWKNINEGVMKYTSRKGTGSEVSVYQIVGFLPGSPKAILEDIITDSENIKKWAAVVDVQIVERCTDKDFPYELYRQVHASVYGGLISPRDYCLLRSWRVQPDGSIHFIAISVEDDRIEVKTDFVRGMLYFQGWHLQTHPTKEGYCEARCIIHTNPMGSLPGWVVSRGVAGEVSEHFGRITKIQKDLQQQ